MKTGVELIAEERQRQIEVEGYSAQHDSQHNASEFVYAAISYVESAKVGINCMEIGNTNENEIMLRKIEMGKNYDVASHSGLRDFYDNVKVKCKDAKEYDSLFPQNTWKPSDEQITWLYRAADDASKDSRMKQILNELLSDLKKLREE